MGSSTSSRALNELRRLRSSLLGNLLPVRAPGAAQPEPDDDGPKPIFVGMDERDAADDFDLNDNLESGSPAAALESIHHDGEDQDPS